MRKIIGLNFLFLFVFTVYPQTISITGKVSNQNGTPVAGAKVTLLGKALATTTDAGGAYSITGGTAALNPLPITQAGERISYARGSVFIGLTQASTVKIDRFDMKGRLAASIFEHRVSAGNYRFNVETPRCNSAIMAVRVSIGNRISTFRYCQLLMRTPAISSENQTGSFQGRLAKSTTYVDSLRVTAFGYVSNTAYLPGYSAVINFTLDTNILGKFSFFVTSLNALQELSENPKGFGGDLRFGKTGPMAGLLGADSICACIAEKSMPGSSVKKWRAFLSATNDGACRQVNAIDRIGQGPWYDRLGRLVASTTSDLLHDRPMNGDSAVRKDLPNELGLPNHWATSYGREAENFIVITGSGADGRLYSQTATCLDWTSTSADNGSKPRGGLVVELPSLGGFSMGKKGSAPGAGSAGGSVPDTASLTLNWISAWNAQNCEPGNTTDAGDKPLPPSIGSGGGYGGFYCFALTP